MVAELCPRDVDICVFIPQLLLGKSFVGEIAEAEPQAGVIDGVAFIVTESLVRMLSH